MYPRIASLALLFLAGGISLQAQQTCSNSLLSGTYFYLANGSVDAARWPPRVEGLVSDFHLLLEEQIPKLMRYATALTRDADEAEELIAETIREALAEQRRCRGNLRVWLLTLLHDLRGNPFRRSLLMPARRRSPTRTDR